MNQSEQGRSLPLGFSLLGLFLLALNASATQQPQRLPRQESAKTAAVQGVVRTPSGRTIGGVAVEIRSVANGKLFKTTTDAEGVFRILDLPPGAYELKTSHPGYQPGDRRQILLKASEVFIVELTLQPVAAPSKPEPRLPARMEIPASAKPEAAPPEPGRELPRRGEVTIPPPITLPPPEDIFTPMPDRWQIPEPKWNRYGRKGDYPYVKGRWWDPFNRNKLKGDMPIFGNRTFLNLLAVSDTLFEGRRLPVTSNISAARPGSKEFFGKGEQAFLAQTFRFIADLFHGDTSFRPFDFRIRVTPAVNLNYLKARERGIVNINVRQGTDRVDAHAGLQEAFVEAKLADLSTNYDFVSLRAGIQGFNSDFRGFIFSDEQPGVRLFGNLFSNRWEYNAAYFFLLDKDTNSLLNTFDARHQQVLVANLYMQDFFWKGYTAQFSLHFNKDDATVHYDENDFLVRPAPVGTVAPHNIRSAYLGWTGNGHIGRYNISHAFYQALGRDDLNQIAGRRVTINAQFAALELSYDRDWLRFKGSFLWASGDANPRDARARGFDSIVDSPSFAGGIFSLWNRQAIRLTGTGVALVGPNSLLPNLRTSKDQGQSNFVNPGLFLYNAGMDVELTPKLRSVLNFNFLRFDRTESLEQLLFQSPIRHTIGLDSSLGFQYRPPLSENMVLSAGAAALIPGQGFADIYTRKTLFSFFANLRMQF